MARPKAIDKMSQAELERGLTKEQKALLADIKIGKHDPVYFANEILDIPLHDGQKLWLWMTTKTQLDKALELGLKLGVWKSKEEFIALREANPDMLKNIMVPSNRWGKTFVTSVKHIWYCFYKKGVPGTSHDIALTRCGTLNLSPHSNQAQAGYDYILDILQSKHTYVIDGVGKRNHCRIGYFLVGNNAQKRLIQFNNSTTYRAVPTGDDQASSIAGTHYLYISYDECAQSLHLKEELPAKIMSRLIDYGGPLDLLSTPEVDKPSHQYFHRIAKLGKEGKLGWFTLVGKISDNRFLPAKEVEQTLEAIRTTDPNKWRQVKFGEFISTGKKMFNIATVERIWNDFTEGKIILPIVGNKYLISADWGFADSGDPTVLYVLDYTEALDETKPKHLRRYHIVYHESIIGGDPIAVLTKVKILQREWNDAKFIHDSASMGGTIIKKLLRSINLFNLVDFSATKYKMDMLLTMIIVLTENRKVKIGEEQKIIDENADFGRLRGFLIPALEEQMGNYQYNPAKGVSDKNIDQDEVMALGMALWYLDKHILKMQPKAIGFNPLAPDSKGIFGEEAVKVLQIQDVTLPESRIL